MIPGRGPAAHNHFGGREHPADFNWARSLMRAEEIAGNQVRIVGVGGAL